MLYIVTKTDCDTSDTEVLKVFNDNLNAIDYIYNLTKTDTTHKFIINERGLDEYVYNNNWIMTSKTLKKTYKIHEYDDKSDLIEDED